MVKYLDPDLILNILTRPIPRTPHYATGYGAKIPTRYMLACTDGKARRVYAICYGNAASLYVIVNRTKQFLSDSPEWYANH